MAESSKASVVTTTDRAATVLVLSGQWKDNLYRMPPRGDIRPDQFVDILVHSDGTRADWPHTA